ncbi:phosphotransferase [Actinomyces sp. ZJ308]|uniref:phosphotransferase n=1 Tax=Actinomyces sp. ZJ308 TaxID=2708342 RepID=UPI001FB87B51|nr:phosphotransferase [Actinomyces sp. ZJ308]
MTGMLSTLHAVPGIRRAWPEHRTSVPATASIECVDGQGRLRAGHVTAGAAPDLLPYATDPELPALSAHLTGALVVHRAGRRAVVMEHTRVRKIVRPHKAVSLVRAHTTAASVLRVTGLRTPRILGDADDVVDLELLPGRSLDELGDAGLPAWRRLADSWAHLARAEADLPVHGPRQETEVLRRWFASAHRYGVIDQSNLLREQVVDTCLRLREDDGAHVIAHRDLHDGQLLWDGRDLSLLDLDTAAMAEAALDLGNLWAHVDLMAVRGRLGPESHARVRDLLDDLARTLPTTTERLEAYYRSSALRLVFVHAFRPAAHRWLPAWVRHCLAEASPFTSLDLTNDWNDS